jgi:hypothetical protein
MIIYSVSVFCVKARYVALCLYTSLCCVFGHSQHPVPRNMKYRDVYHLHIYRYVYGIHTAGVLELEGNINICVMDEIIKF